MTGQCLRTKRQPIARTTFGYFIRARCILFGNVSKRHQIVPAAANRLPAIPLVKKVQLVCIDGCADLHELNPNHARTAASAGKHAQSGRAAGIADARRQRIKVQRELRQLAQCVQACPACALIPFRDVARSGFRKARFRNI
jgi:hypothetical protein